MLQKIKVGKYTFLFYCDKENDHKETDVVGVYTGQTKYHYEVPYDVDSLGYGNETCGIYLQSLLTFNAQKIKALIFYNKNKAHGSHCYNYTRPLCFIYKDSITGHNIVELTAEMHALQRYYTIKKEEQESYIRDEKCHKCRHLLKNKYNDLWQCYSNLNPISVNGIECNNFVDVTEEINIPDNCINNYEMEKKRMLYNLALKYVEIDDDIDFC